MIHKIIAIIPARGGSKGIPRKNIKLLAGKPLVAYSIETALKSKHLDKVIVSTEDDEIAEVSKRYGAKIIERAADLAKDDIPTELVIEHTIDYLKEKERYSPDYIVLLQPTSPLRDEKDIDHAIETILDEKADSLLSVYENDRFYWDRTKNTPLNYDYRVRCRRQEKKWELVENGSIYITKRKLFLNKRNRLGGKITTYLMPKWKSFEIDEPLDFELVEYLMTNKFKRKYYKNKIKNIKLVIFDVDGVFTDGSIYLDELGKEMLKFSRIDGKGIELIKNVGIDIAVISSENSKIVKKRMQKLKIDNIFIGIKNKMKIYEELKEKYSLNDEKICFCGDDLQDLEIIKQVGFSCCPKNAQNVVKKFCHYQSPYTGANGFVRDVCNKIIMLI